MPNDNPNPERWPGDELMENDDLVWEGIVQGASPEFRRVLLADVERDELLERPCPPWRM